MIETMYIGSGDIHALMSGKETKSHIALMQRFVSGVKPNYNAYASPIDALRTGAILENRYLLTLPDNYFTQYVVKSEEMDVFKCSLDFAKIEKGKLVDFDELKTLFLSDYLEFIEPIKNDNKALVEYVKKNISLIIIKYRNSFIAQSWKVVTLSSSLLFLMMIMITGIEKSSQMNTAKSEYPVMRS